MEEERDEVEVQTPLGRVKAAGKSVDFFLILASTVLISLVLWVVIEHRSAAAENTSGLKTTLENNNLMVTNAIKEMTAAQRETNITQREWMCLNTLNPEERKREFLSETGLCKRMSR